MLIPVSTPTIPNLSVITNQVFAERFILVEPPSTRRRLPLGALIGIPLNAVLLVVIIIVVILCLRRRKQRREASLARATTFPPFEPRLQMSDVNNPHELANPVGQAQSPRTPVTSWTGWPGSSPPSYDHSRIVTSPIKLTPAQELPGSTYIHEHHPALSNSRTRTETSDNTPPGTPSTPTRQIGLGLGERVSPVASPDSSIRGVRSPSVMSPLSSPKLRAPTVS